jgi:hypothetical protein
MTYYAYLTKADTVIGYTYNGDVYCPECVAYTDPIVTGDDVLDTRSDNPKPVFISDDYLELPACTVCNSCIG